VPGQTDPRTRRRSPGSTGRSPASTATAPWTRPSACARPRRNMNHRRRIIGPRRRPRSNAEPCSLAWPVSCPPTPANEAASRMTPRAPMLCGNPTCHELVPAGVRYCPTRDPGRWRTTGNSLNSRSADAKWRKTRVRILNRDSHRCRLRYVGICIGLASDADHIIPVSQGGTHHDSNLQAACSPCHRAKSSDEGHVAAGHKPAGRIRYIPGELRGLP
jgi:5-methylcytosine-specific restriction enzyme A